MCAHGWNLEGDGLKCKDEFVALGHDLPESTSNC